MRRAEPLDLRPRHVDVVRAGEIAVGAQESVAVRPNLEDAGHLIQALVLLREELGDQPGTSETRGARDAGFLRLRDELLRSERLEVLDDRQAPVGTRLTRTLPAAAAC